MFPLGEGTADDPVYREIGSSFGVTLSGQPLRIATEAAGRGVITLDMFDSNGERVTLDVPNAVLLANRLLGAAMYWIDMHHVCDRAPVVEVRNLLNAALDFNWE